MNEKLIDATQPEGAFAALVTAVKVPLAPGPILPLLLTQVPCTPRQWVRTQ